jgi:tetratricopeptide (TPR) repeat protein
LIWYFSERFSTSKRNEAFAKHFSNGFDSYGETSSNLSKERRKKKTQTKLDYYLKELKYEEAYNSSNEDSNIFYTLDSISFCYYSLEDVENSIKYAEMSLERRNAVFIQKNEFQVALGHARLGYMHLIGTKKPDQAKTFYETALNIVNEIYSDDNPYKAHYNYRIGCCYFDMNQYDESIKHHLKAYEMRKRIYDFDSEYILDSLNALTECYSKKNDTDRYLKHRREIMKIKRNLFKAKNPTKEYKDIFLIRGKDNGKPAWHYVLVENEEKYEGLKRKESGANIDVSEFGEIIKSGWGENPPHYISAHVENTYAYEHTEFERFKINGRPISSYFFNDENNDTVLKDLFLDLKHKFEFYNDENNHEVLDSLLRLGQYFYENQDSFNCNLYAEKCLEIAKKLLANTQINRCIADALHLKGLCQIKSNTKNAIKTLSESLELRKRVYNSEDHPKVSSSYYKMGDCYLELKQNKEALEYYLKCLEIRKRIFNKGPNVFMSYVLEQIQKCFENENDIDNYFVYRKQVLEIKDALFKIKHPGKTYKDVFLIRGKDNGKPAWHYVLIEDEEKYRELKKQVSGTNIDVTDYGMIVRSGWGIDPSKSIKDQIEEEYGVY